MHPHKFLVSIALILTFTHSTKAQQQKAPPGGRIAVVVDERLAALRATPELAGKLIRRLGRGRLVAIRGSRRREGVMFLLVNVSSRTHGWIQQEAIVSPSHPGDDLSLLSLIKSATDFDRIARARIFLNYFVRSPFRPEVLLILGDAAEQASTRLSRDALRRLGDGGVPSDFSYLMNYAGLDRYNRQGVVFVFDRVEKRFHYNGAAWREILRRYPKSLQAPQARQRLEKLLS